MRNRLIEQRGRVAGRAFGGAGDQGQRVVSDLCSLAGRDFAHQGDHDFWFDAAQIKPLTARQHCDRDLANLGGRKDEFDVGGWLFERFEQRVEGAG